MQYKKVGDTFTFAEYNALCYLLCHGSWNEEAKLSLNKSGDGEFASYTLLDSNDLLSETRDGFVFVKNIDSLSVKNRLVYLKIEHEYFHSRFEVTLNTVHKTHISQIMADKNSIDVTIQKEDFIDVVGTNEEAITMYNNSDITPTSEDITISLEADTSDDDSILISFDPVSYGLTKGDFISDSCNVNLRYVKPEINYTDGELGDDDEIIVETFNELQQVINTAPENSVTKIRLLGKEYVFTDEIVIDNKTIQIHGGNIDLTSDEPFTTLNAKNIGRHFRLTTTGQLSINNCKLINGNVYGEKGRQILHQRGGSVYIHAKYVIDYDHLIIQGGMFFAENCWFVNNTAMLGGAIYNTMGKCEVKHCRFDGNKAIQEDRSGKTNTYDYKINNWGGAIMTETSNDLYYNDCTDRLRIATSQYTYDSSTDVTTLELYFYKLQNTLLLEKEDITVKNLKLFNYTSKEWIPLTSITTVKQTSEPTLSNKYVIKFKGQFTKNNKVYFKFIGNSSHPSIISHLVTIKEGVIE